MIKKNTPTVLVLNLKLKMIIGRIIPWLIQPGQLEGTTEVFNTK